MEQPEMLQEELLLLRLQLHRGRKAALWMLRRRRRETLKLGRLISILAWVRRSTLV
jgi:hypothetical protein